MTFECKSQCFIFLLLTTFLFVFVESHFEFDIDHDPPPMKSFKVTPPEDKCGDQLENFLSSPNRFKHGAFLGRVMQILLRKGVFFNEDRNVTAPYDFKTPEDLAKMIDLSVGEDPTPFTQLYTIIEQVIENSPRASHPFMLDKRVAGLDPYALAADWLADTMSNLVVMYIVAPIYTIMEREMAERLRILFNWPEVQGVTTSGAGAGNSLAVALALQHKWPMLKIDGLVGVGNPKAVMFVSEASSYAFDKAQEYSGLAKKWLIKIRTDPKTGRMDIGDLEFQIKRAKSDGWEPFMIVATAGTPVLGAVDDIDAISTIALANQLWLHVDAERGGGAIFETSANKCRLKGIRGADSVLFSGWMFQTPYVSSFLVTRFPAMLSDSFGLHASYVWTGIDLYNEGEWDTGDFTIQTSRRPEIAKFWFTWKARGNDGLREHVTRVYENTAIFIKLLKARKESFDLVLEEYDMPQVAFNYVPVTLRNMDKTTQDYKDKLDAVTRKLKLDLLNDGILQLSTGERSPNRPMFLIVTLTNSVLHGDDLKYIVDVIEHYGEMQLQGAGGGMKNSTMNEDKDTNLMDGSATAAPMPTVTAEGKKGANAKPAKRGKRSPKVTTKAPAGKGTTTKASKVTPSKPGVPKKPAPGPAKPPPKSNANKPNNKDKDAPESRAIPMKPMREHAIPVPKLHEDIHKKRPFVNSPIKELHERFFVDTFQLFLKKGIFFSRRESPSKFQQPEHLKTIVDFNLGDEPTSHEDLLVLFERIIEYSPHWGHPYFIYQLAAGLDPFTLAADYIASAVNSPMITYEDSPVFTLMQNEVMKSFRKRIFGSEEGDGVFTDGGSMANQLPIAIARHIKDQKVKTEGLGYLNKKFVLFVSEDGHYSTKKGAIVQSIGGVNAIHVEANEIAKMEVKVLEEEIKKSLANGDIPFMIVITIGTTIYGGIDDVQGIVGLCEKYKLWCHVDGMFGGLIAMSDTHIKRIPGIEKVDSYGVDLHKLMGSTMVMSALITRKKNVFKDTFAINSPIDFSTRLGTEGFYSKPDWDLGDHHWQVDKRNNLFKFWFLWKAKGRKGLGQHVDKIITNAQYLISELHRRDAFTPVIDNFEITNVCFYFTPPFLRDMDPTTEEWQDQMSRVSMMIERALVRDDVMCIVSQKRFFKGGKTATFIKFVMMGSSLTKEDINYLLDSIEYYGNEIKQLEGPEGKSFEFAAELQEDNFDPFGNNPRNWINSTVAELRKKGRIPPK